MRRTKVRVLGCFSLPLDILVTQICGFAVLLDQHVFAEWLH